MPQIVGALTSHAPGGRRASFVHRARATMSYTRYVGADAAPPGGLASSSTAPLASEGRSASCAASLDSTLQLVGTRHARCSSRWRVSSGTAGPTAWLARTAAGGAAVASIYLTIVLVVGFVSPLPTPIDPGFRSVFGAVAAGTVAGALLGAVVGSAFAVCRRVAAVAVRDAERAVGRLTDQGESVLDGLGEAHDLLHEAFPVED